MNTRAWLLLAWAAPAFAAVDVGALWDFNRPAESEARFRAALAGASGDDALVLRTQIARTFSLRGRFDEAHREIDAIEPLLATAGPEPRVRALLERGRTLRSGKRLAEARPLFVSAFEHADRAGLHALAADALHMVALVEPATEDQIAWHRRTIDYARRFPAAQYWQAPALNNLGMTLKDAGRLDDALAAFVDAQTAYERHRPSGVPVARWMVAHTLRLLKRHDEALAIQLALERHFDAAGEPDPHVYEELALLHEAKGQAARAAHYRALHQQHAAR